jgi:hypothetical protein
MKTVFPVEVRRFYAIEEINSFLDESMKWYSVVISEYDQRLGELLRKPDGSKDEELLKKLSEHMSREKDSRDKKNKKGKKEENSDGDSWFNFKGIRFSADSKGIVETFFEAADTAKKNLEKLKGARELIDDLLKIGFPEGLAYSVYFVEGVPQMVYVEKTGGVESRYRFEMTLSTENSEQKESGDDLKKGQLTDALSTEATDNENSEQKKSSDEKKKRQVINVTNRGTKSRR